MEKSPLSPSTVKQESASQETVGSESLKYAFNVEKVKREGGAFEFSYPDATVEAVNEAIEKGGLDDFLTVAKVADIVEQRTLNGARFNRLSATPAKTEFSERRAIIQYVDDTARLISEIEQNNYEAMIYLDKSAHPVPDFVEALWSQFAKDESKKPSKDFLNIDRIAILHRYGYQATEETPSETLKENWDDLRFSRDEKVRARWREDAARIRQLFIEGEVDESNLEEAFNHPSSLDGKAICVVDEVKMTGATNEMATSLLKIAFPDSKIESSYFWSGPKPSVPIWYEKKITTGRGVGDVSEAYYQRLNREERTPESLRRSLGAFAISAPHYNANMELIADKAYELLLEDVKTLADLEMFALGDYNDEDQKTKTKNLFYKKLKAMGYKGGDFSESAIEGLFVGNRQYPAKGFLNARKKK